MKPQEKQVKKLFSQLDESNQGHLLAYMEFLVQRQSEENQGKPIPEPLGVPRPEKESVVSAIKRLSATFPMLDKAKMLNDTSVLVTQHVMQGRAADEVIDDLEILFRQHYEILIEKES